MKTALSDSGGEAVLHLVHFKVYPNCDLAGLLFDLDRTQANRWVIAFNESYFTASLLFWGVKTFKIKGK